MPEYIEATEDEEGETTLEETQEDDTDIEEETNNTNNQNKPTNKENNQNNKPKEYYIGYLEIPKIKFKRGFVDIKSKDNDVSKNITIISGSKYPNVEKGNFIIAGHSGTGVHSYFKNLYKLKTNDEAYVYYKNVKYTYKIVKIYNQPKDGTVAIYRDYNKTTLTLITCTKDNKKSQTVYVAELQSKERY
jgi:LPXTG-site transpeptidase (sortase) family protein